MEIRNPKRHNVRCPSNMELAFATPYAMSCYVVMPNPEQEGEVLSASTQMAYHDKKPGLR